MSCHVFSDSPLDEMAAGFVWGRARTFSGLHLCTDAILRHAAQVNRTATPWIIGVLTP